MYNPLIFILRPYVASPDLFYILQVRDVNTFNPSTNVAIKKSASVLGIKEVR